MEGLNAELLRFAENNGNCALNRSRSHQVRKADLETEEMCKHECSKIFAEGGHVRS